MKAYLSVIAWSGVHERDENRWGPQLALTRTSPTGTGYWHSGGETEPWIKFKMAEETEVDRIQIIDRQDCCPERFENVEVRFGKDFGNDYRNSVTCGTQSYIDSKTYTFNCPEHVRGDIIYIKKHGTTTNLFHINNVEVWKRTSAGELDPEFILCIILILAILILI